MENKSVRFAPETQKKALMRQRFKCGSCGTKIYEIGEEGRTRHYYGEIAHAHHIKHIKFKGDASLRNCVIICQSCHYSAHEGGNYRYGDVTGNQNDFPYYR